MTPMRLQLGDIERILQRQLDQLVELVLSG
jgi:hypothetical protein